MQAPPVQYVTTEDGVRIAFTVSGSGPPIVLLTEPSASHVELEWSEPVLGQVFARLAQRTMLVRFDVRGTGLSDRITEPGENPVYSDLRAVIERLGLEHYVLGGVQGLAPAAIIYASRYPDEVRKLALIDPGLRVMDMILSPQLTAILTAATADWTIATEAIGMHVFGIGRSESREFGAYIRSCIGPEFYSVALRAAGILDATAAAPSVKAPTLVVRHAEHPYISAETAREVTASIPAASLITVPGLWAEDPVGVTDRVLDWLLST